MYQFAYIFVERCVLVLITYAAVVSLYAVPVLALRGLLPDSPVIGAVAGLASCTLGGLVLWRYHAAVIGHMGRLGLRSSWLSTAGWVASCVALGLSLRAAWVLYFPGQPVSDGATYVALARKLIAGEPYQADGLYAYWPPGYPLFLAAWLWAIRSQPLAIFLSNCALFAIGSIGVWLLARQLLADHGARLAVLLFCIWPNYVFQAGLPEKEQVLIALLPWVLLPAADRSAPLRAWSSHLASGLLLGAMVLVQPILQLFPLVLVLYWVLRDRSVARSALRTAILVAGMAMAIAPWTARNQQVLGAFVLVSTNGGVGIYNANNALATGGYMPRGEIDLSALPELEADREGRRLAREWIVENPRRFLTLAFEKNLRLMGDDSVGAYQSFVRTGAQTQPALYAAVKGVANLYWLGLWALILAGSIRCWRNRERIEPAALIVPLAFLYTFAVHSVVESAGNTTC